MILTLIRYKRCKNLVVARTGIDCTPLIAMHRSVIPLLSTVGLLLAQGHEGLKQQINQSLVKVCKDKYDIIVHRYRIHKHIEPVLLVHVCVYGVWCVSTHVCLSLYGGLLSDCFEWMIIVDLSPIIWLLCVSLCVCVCVCVCWLVFSCAAMQFFLCACARTVRSCVFRRKRSTVFWLHGPYPVMEVFAVTGKTRRHLDSVAGARLIG